MNRDALHCEVSQVSIEKGPQETARSSGLPFLLNDTDSVMFVRDQVQMCRLQLKSRETETVCHTSNIYFVF